jgi:hypothetical protein
MLGYPYVCSWGFDDQLIAIRAATVEIRGSDAVLRALGPSVQVTVHICMGIRDISTAATPEVRIVPSNGGIACRIPRQKQT